MQKLFRNEAEKEDYLLDKNEISKIDKLYLNSYNEYIRYSARELVEKSHKNFAWIEACGDLGPNDICHTKLNEDNGNFTKFEF